MAQTRLAIEWLSEPTPDWRTARDSSTAGPHLGDPWIRYSAALGRTPHFLILRNHQAIDSIGVVYLQKSRRRFWRKPSATLDRLPVSITGDESLEAIEARVDALCDFSTRERWSSLSIESLGGPTPPPDLARRGFVVRDRFEFTIDLRRDDDSRWSEIKQSHRRKIRKAEKAGVTIRDARDPAVELHALQKSTSERRAAQGEQMDYLSEERYRLLCETLGDDATALIAELDAEPVSSMLIAKRGPHSYYLLGGTNERGLAANAASLVFWEASRRLHASGLESLNLGGTPADAADGASPSHGLYRFKLGWGTTPSECRSGTRTR